MYLLIKDRDWKYPIFTKKGLFKVVNQNGWYRENGIPVIKDPKDFSGIFKAKQWLALNGGEKCKVKWADE